MRRIPSPIRGSFAVGVLACLLFTGCTGNHPPGHGEVSTSALSGTTAPSPHRSADPPGPSPSVIAKDPAAASAAALDTEVSQALSGLNRRQQVAQLFVLGVPLTDLSSGDALVRDLAVGGVFLRGRSSSGAPAIAATTGRWAVLAPKVRPWVAADQEGGQVQTLSGQGFSQLPTAQDQGRLPADQLGVLAEGLGSSLATAGVNLDLAPVADVVPAGTERTNAPIGAYGRQYGSSAEVVAAGAGRIVRGLADHDVTATVKHFPGLGRVSANTDTNARVTDTVTTRDDPQVTVFRSLALSPGDPFVMVSSAVYTRIDAAGPAVFSSRVVTDLLRRQLDFRGVVISDDLGAAKAVQGIAPGDRAVSFLAAGGTLVLSVTPSIAPQMIDAVLARAAADPVFSAVVDAAVRAALLAKARSGLLSSG